MKKLLLLLICATFMFSCGENDKYDFYFLPEEYDALGNVTIESYVFNKETGELWHAIEVDYKYGTPTKTKSIRKIISKEDLNSQIKTFKDLLDQQFKTAKDYNPKIEWFEGT